MKKLYLEFMRLINENTSYSKKEEPITTNQLKAIFIIGDYSTKRGTLVPDDLHNFLKWATLRGIFRKKKIDGERPRYLINPNKFYYYLNKHLCEDIKVGTK